MITNTYFKPQRRKKNMAQETSYVNNHPWAILKRKGQSLHKDLRLDNNQSLCLILPHSSFS
jgi:hypothetical protein